MRIFSTVYIFLFVYVVVALLFWGQSLQKQSNKIYETEIELLKFEVDSTKSPEKYNEDLSKLEHNHNMRTKQYIGEGSTFLIVILLGALIVFKSIRRRILLSRQQNNFMLSVTHELKSPLAGIKLNLQTLERHKLDEEKRKIILERCIKESDRLNDLCNNMLYASRIEGRNYKPTKEKFDLSEVVYSCFLDYSSRYPGRFEENIVSELEFSGDKMMLQIAVNNLLENAVKYTPKELIVTVGLSAFESKAIISVADKGMGVPDSEKRNIFNKFYRIGNEESRKTKGTGLGLYLTNKIIQQHNGHISVKDNIPNGAIFEIVLPV